MVLCSVKEFFDVEKGFVMKFKILEVCSALQKLSLYTTLQGHISFLSKFICVLESEEGRVIKIKI